MRYGDLAFAVLVVAGLALVGYGLAQPDFVSGLSVDGPVEESGIYEGDTVVTYENLTSDQKQVFDRARTDGSTKHSLDGWPADVVRYDGQYYDASRWGGENGRRTLSIAAGWGIVIVGVAGLAGLHLLRRLRGT